MVIHGVMKASEVTRGLVQGAECYLAGFILEQ